MASRTSDPAPPAGLAARRRAITAGVPSRAERALHAGLVVFAAYHLLLAAWMVFLPHTFFDRVGPFGSRNDHYIRDNATYAAAVGVALAAAVRRPSWRVPVLALTTVQFALHSINHLFDIDRAHPAWNGPADFASLALATLLLGWLLLGAVREQRTSPSTQGASP